MYSMLALIFLFFVGGLGGVLFGAAASMASGYADWVAGLVG
jgi:hypothetical protein